MENEHDKAVEPIVLTEPRSKLIFLLVVMIGFIALGVLLMQGGDFWLGLGAVVFCSAASISLIAQLRSNRVRSLRIDSTGLTYHSLLGSSHVPWKNIARLGIGRIKTASSTKKFVAWNYSPGATRPADRVFMDMTLLGFDAGCPAIGLSAEDLLELLNKFHGRYAKASGA